jgi:predicted cupin superfamily sugar epimerase
MENQKASYWIKQLDLQPHPEGGYYKEVFRSDIGIKRLSAPKSNQACTSIFYLLEGADFSAFHRIASDELWYFHMGTPLLIHAIDEAGNYSAQELSDKPSGSLFAAIKAGLWFAAEIPSETGFVLVSCAVAPGFEFAEFEMAKKQVLSIQYPRHHLIIDKFCR